MRVSADVNDIGYGNTVPNLIVINGKSIAEGVITVDTEEGTVLRFKNRCEGETEILAGSVLLMFNGGKK